MTLHREMRAEHPGANTALWALLIGSIVAAFVQAGAVIADAARPWPARDGPRMVRGCDYRAENHLHDPEDWKP